MSIFGDIYGRGTGSGGGGAGPSPAPDGEIVAFDATSVTAKILALSGQAGTTVTLQTRALRSVDLWVDQASDATPAPNDTLTAINLTTGNPLEARLVEVDANGNVADGVHFIICPASSVWLTLLNTVGTVLLGLGVVPYKGEVLPASPEAAAALLRQRPESERAAGNGVVELEYPVEIDMQLIQVSDTGELRTADVAAYHEALRRAFDKRGLESYASIPGLSQIAVTVRSKTDPRTGDDGLTVTHAVLEVRFTIVEAR